MQTKRKRVEQVEPKTSLASSSIPIPIPQVITTQLASEPRVEWPNMPANQYPISNIKIGLPVYMPVPSQPMTFFVYDPPKFSGDGCTSQINSFFDQFNCSEQKLKMALTCIQGKPRRILDSRGQITSLDQLYTILRKTYGARVKEVNRLITTKQMADEPVRVFAARVAINVYSTGVKEEQMFDKFVLGIFLKGLRNEIDKQLLSNRPKTFEEAIEIATEYDEELKTKPRTQLATSTS